MESVGGPLYFCITVKASIIYHTLATQPIKKFEAPEISLLAHIASLKKICLKMCLNIFSPKY